MSESVSSNKSRRDNKMSNQVNSKRGKKKFIESGFSYIFDKLSADEATAFYRCEQKDRCKARVHVQNKQVTKRIQDHTHEPTPAKIEVEMTRTKIKERAVDSQESTAQVINNCLNSLSQAAQASMPKTDALRKVVRRQRKQIHAPPPAPANLMELELPEEYQFININGQQERFLLIDSGPSPTRILIYGREANIRYFLNVALIADLSN